MALILEAYHHSMTVAVGGLSTAAGEPGWDEEKAVADVVVALDEVVVACAPVASSTADEAVVELDESTVPTTGVEEVSSLLRNHRGELFEGLAFVKQVEEYGHNARLQRRQRLPGWTDREHYSESFVGE